MLPRRALAAAVAGAFAILIVECAVRSIQRAERARGEHARERGALLRVIEARARYSARAPRYAHTR